MKRVFITGIAGFIGYHVAKSLLERGDQVIGIDNLNSYYVPALKRSRLSELVKVARDGQLSYLVGDIANKANLESVFEREHFDCVINLAAQAGVRYSLENPDAYVQSNVVGFSNLLEMCRKYGKPHLIYASSSSVYGMNQKMPFSESDRVDSPVSLYAATKRSNELFAYTYSHLFNIPTTGLRFFTVYGPWGRPDMAYFGFTKSILEGKTINVFDIESMERDFTYIDDIVRSIVALVDVPPRMQIDPSTGLSLPAVVYNIGNSNPVRLKEFIKIIESACGRVAQINNMPRQPGDVVKTFADTTNLEKCVGFSPAVSIAEGIPNFVRWYRDYYSV